MAEEIIKNIFRIIIPLPNNPLKSLNSYFIKSDTGRNLLIDTGFNRPECLEAIEEGLADAGAVMEDTDLFITHLHSDHCGLIAYLRDRGSRVYAGKTDGDLINYETGEEYWKSLTICLSITVSREPNSAGTPTYIPGESITMKR